MSTDSRGFASMSRRRVEQIASEGGKASPTKFKPGEARTIQAAHKGGEARAAQADVRNGELGRKGARARWSR